MSKFSGLIAEARKADTSVKPEEQKARKPVLQKEQKTAPKPIKKPVKTAPQAIKVARSREDDVNLTIKIPKSRRMHWVAEAKRAGLTITEVICDALSKKFGEP